MSKNILFLLLVCISFGCKRKNNKIDWNNLNSFKVCISRYPIPSIGLINQRDIDTLRFININIKQAIEVLKKSNAVEEVYLWKNFVFGIMTFNDGQQYKIQISSIHPTFFMYELNQRFEITDNKTKEAWFKTISENQHINNE